MGQLYPYYAKWVKTIVAILHIYGARDVLLLFCDHQDTESELLEVEIGAAEIIYNRKISKALWDNYIHTMQYGTKMLWQLFIFMEL